MNLTNKQKGLGLSLIGVLLITPDSKIEYAGLKIIIHLFMRKPNGEGGMD